jgi:hypothetical protein
MHYVIALGELDKKPLVGYFPAKKRRKQQLASTTKKDYTSFYCLLQILKSIP